MSEDKPKRPRPYSYRPPAARLDELAALIDQSGLSANAFFTEAIFGRTRHRPAEMAMLAKILSHTAAMADKARSVSATCTDTELLRDCHSDLKIVRALLMQRMNRER